MFVRVNSSKDCLSQSKACKLMVIRLSVALRGLCLKFCIGNTFKNNRILLKIEKKLCLWMFKNHTMTHNNPDFWVSRFTFPSNYNKNLAEDDYWKLPLHGIWFSVNHNHPHSLEYLPSALFIAWLSLQDPNKLITIEIKLPKTSWEQNMSPTQRIKDVAICKWRFDWSPSFACHCI